MGGGGWTTWPYRTSKEMPVLLTVRTESSGQLPQGARGSLRPLNVLACYPSRQRHGQRALLCAQSVDRVAEAGGVQGPGRAVQSIEVGMLCDC